MIRRLLHLARFFIVVPVVPAAILIAFGVATLVGGGVLVINVQHGLRAVAPVLLLQLFAAASGFVVPARRGYYDLLLTRGDSRLAIAVVHWAMSVFPGILSWSVLAAVERMYGGAALVAPGTLLALFVVSTLPWSVTVPLPRLTGAIVWLLVFAFATAALPGPNMSAASLLLPWALLGTDPHPFTTAIVMTCIAVTMAAAFAGINRMDVPLESGQ
jgi:hypothetical protein